MEDPLVLEKKESSKVPIERYLGIWCTNCLQTKIRMRTCSSCCFEEEEEGVQVDVCECTSMFCVIPMCCAYTKPIPCVGCFYRSGSRRNKLSFKFGDIVLGHDLRILRTRYRLNENNGNLIDEIPSCTSSKTREECRICRIPCCFC